MHDVAIIGGGPAGLFAALALHAIGVDVALIAEEPAANNDARTTALLDGSIRALTRLGVWEALQEQAAPLRTMRLVDDTGRLFRAPTLTCHASEIGLEAFGFNIENRLINNVLSASLAEKNIPLHKKRAQTLVLEQGEARITTSDDGEITARLVVGADGRNSLVRKAAGIELNSETYPQVAITTNARVERPHLDTSTEFHTVDGPFTIVPLPNRHVSIVCAVKPDKADAIMAMPDAEWGLELERRAHSLLGKMEVVGRRGRFPLGRATPKSFAGAGWALIGEAAHIIPPIGAQGLNLGMRDGAALADVIKDARAGGNDFAAVDAMQRYDVLRRPDIVSRTITVDLFNKSLFSSFFPLHSMRGAGLWLMDQVPAIRRTFMREGLQPQGREPSLMRA